VILTLYLTRETLQAEQMPGITMNIYLGVYGVMTWFLTSNFYKLCIGSWYALRGKAANPWHPAHRAKDPGRDVRVAIIYPVYHEDVSRVAAGMAATWASIARDHPDMARHFDSFLLSDSRKTEYWIAEQAAIYRLRDEFPGARFFYRRRGSNLNAKMGNTIDFCRRWGHRYDYMVVMDADSIMSGDALVDLLRMMEGNNRIGILQTNPKPILRQSLFGRMNQFAGRLYGSVFSYSLQAVHMGHASYIGHNAMIRMKPFIQHCVLPELSGPAPWGGKPLSHDIIESALMARAGYEVWFLPDVEGSYEEIPANMLGFLIRERRWMQGNLQHFRFLALGGLRSTHRETFFTGAMGYMAAPLWAVFLVVSAYGMIHFLQDGTLGAGGLGSLEVPMTLLLLSSVVFLFMPRLLAIVVNIQSDTAVMYGGKAKLLASLVTETLFSFFFSPIMMAYITKFVWLWAKRRSISWGTQQRDDAPLPWRSCLDHFGWVSAVGIISWYLMYQETTGIGAVRGAMIEAISGGWASPADIMFWFFPILAGLSLSPLIARFTSRTFPRLQAAGLFLVPEEVAPPRVVADTEVWTVKFRMTIPDPEDSASALKFAKTDVHFYVKHRSSTRIRPHVADWLIPKIIEGSILDQRQTLLALSERSCFDALHEISVVAGRSSGDVPGAVEPRRESRRL
jgi:membrane glycosyltransferase